MGTLIMIGQVLLSLSILVVLHEWGHFYAARTFNTKVEKFYLFFNPGFSLFKKQIGETEYGIGWLPLGGYVKIAGMIDESFDTEQMEGPAQPWEFRAKPAWQRLIIMLGGVLVNFVLGFFIYAMIMWYYGESYLPAENAPHGIHVVDSIAYDIGLENGDKILKVGDVEFDKFESGILTREIVLNDARNVTLVRAGSQMVIKVPEDVVPKLSSYGRSELFVPRFTVSVDSVSAGGNADKAGLLKGDKFVSINGQESRYLDQFMNLQKSIAGQNVTLVVERTGALDTLQAQVDDESKFGFIMVDALASLKMEKIKYGFFEAFPMGIKKGLGFLGTQLKAFGQMGKGNIDVKESVGGPIAIATLFGDVWDWSRFWGLTAALSLILAFMNLLPIPALDGGHVMFLLWEMVTGRKPSDKFLEYATLAGFIILMALMVFIFGNDIRRVISGLIYGIF